MIAKFFLSFLVCVGGGWLTGLLTRHGVREWYPDLVKSSLTPPDIVFPIVWTILYICMAISLALVWSSHSKDKTKAMIFFGIQLILNFMWSWLFFNLKQPNLAFCDILLLWMALAYTIVLFKRHSLAASYLLIPYMLWVSFAIYLNAYICLHN